MSFPHFTRLGRSTGRVAVAASVGLLALAMFAAPSEVGAVSAVSTPVISSSASNFVTTNGDILAERVLTVGGKQAIAIGGNFTDIVTASGSPVAASNFAVIQESNAQVLYAAPSVSSGGYVRAITSAGGVIYVGGNFTAFAGAARAHVAGISTSTWQLTNWAPNVAYTVRALAEGGGSVFVGGNGASVSAYSEQTAVQLWSQPVSGGLVKGLRVDDALGTVFVAGYFNSIGGFTNHGLIELTLTTGSPITTFTPVFEPNNQPGAHPSYNGEDPFSVSVVNDGSASYLAVASGGIHNYVRLLNISTGADLWGRATVGDGQAVAAVGTSVVVGYHRWRPNTNIAWPYFAAQLTEAGALTSWNPHLSGTQNLADDGGNGTMALAYDATSHTLFVGGAFTRYNANCNTTGNVSCTGGTKMQSLAAYTVSGT